MGFQGVLAPAVCVLPPKERFSVHFWGYFWCTYPFRSFPQAEKMTWATLRSVFK
jgi:hypothetical protein